MQRDKGYDFIRFFAMMLILLWHFYTTCTENSIVVYPLLISVIDHGGFSFGGVGVGLFFILSGALLRHNYGDEEKFSTIVFLKKRIIRICIPLWISFVASLLISSIANGTYINYVKENPLGCMISFLGFSFAGDLWNRIGINTLWITGEWFTSVILVVYSLFPLFRKLLKTRMGGYTSLIVGVIFVLNMKYQILSGGDGYFSFSNGIMYFWLGMIFDKYRQLITKQVAALAVLACVLIWILNPVTIAGFNYLPVFLASCLSFIILYNIRVDNTVTRYICKYNYEIYLVHHRIFILVMPYWLNGESRSWQILFCLGTVSWLTFLIAENLKVASKNVADLICNI